MCLSFGVNRPRDFLFLICEIELRIHTEVIISAQPRWLCGHVNASSSNPSQSHVGNPKCLSLRSVLMTFSQQPNSFEFLNMGF